MCLRGNVHSPNLSVGFNLASQISCVTRFSVSYTRVERMRGMSIAQEDAYLRIGCRGCGCGIGVESVAADGPRVRPKF